MKRGMLSSLTLSWILILALASLLCAGETTRVSVSSDGTQGNKYSRGSVISADGRFVAFDSDASNLVTGDTNNVMDVFVHDRQTGVTEMVSVASDGTRGNKASDWPSISPDGRFVVFSSTATNLVPGDTNNTSDVFLRDRQTGVTERISVSNDGTQGNGYSQTAGVSADGRFVSFSSDATNLVPDDTNGKMDIFVRDRLTGTNERVNVTTGGAQSNIGCHDNVISADGRFVAFTTSAKLVPEDTNTYPDVYVRDLQAGVTERVSLTYDGKQANSDCNKAGISADGRFVSFRSAATNLVPDDTNGQYDVFLRDRHLAGTSRISVSSEGVQGNGESGSGWSSKHSSISPDGRFVTFESYATNLVPGDTNGKWDAFVRDRLLGITERVSVSSDGTEANGSSCEKYSPSISADGRFVAFDSYGSNLVPDDTNGVKDIFVRDRIGDTPPPDPVTILEAKHSEDGTLVRVTGAIVSAAWENVFYIEADDRSSGIRVEKAAHGLTTGTRADVTGEMQTNDDSERYIDATGAVESGSGTVSPLEMIGRSLGGSSLLDPVTGVGQQGVSGGSGLNNIGLLVTTSGQVTQVGSDYLYIDDGSNLRDGTVTGSEENVGVRVVCDPAGYAPEDQLLVTGISSCFNAGSGLARRVIVRTASDITKP